MEEDIIQMLGIESYSKQCVPFLRMDSTLAEKHLLTDFTLNDNNEGLIRFKHTKEPIVGTSENPIVDKTDMYEIDGYYFFLQMSNITTLKSFISWLNGAVNKWEEIEKENKINGK